MSSPITTRSISETTGAIAGVRSRWESIRKRIRRSSPDVPPSHRRKIRPAIRGPRFLRQCRILANRARHRNCPAACLMNCRSAGRRHRRRLRLIPAPPISGTPNLSICGPGTMLFSNRSSRVTPSHTMVGSDSGWSEWAMNNAHSGRLQNRNKSTLLLLGRHNLAQGCQLIAASTRSVNRLLVCCQIFSKDTDLS
jgi:hypothetical protein